MDCGASVKESDLESCAEVLTSFVLFFATLACHDRRPTSEYFESRDEYLFNEMDFRLRLDSAVESDSFSESPCSSAEHSPNLAEKGRLNLGGSDAPDNDNDNVSDESGYSDDKDVISSSSSASDVGAPSTATQLVALSASSLPSSALKVPFLMAEEFTLNL